jgi:hypothetical protein
METARIEGRNSHRAQASPSDEGSRALVSYKRVLQAGSVAAAFGSILALALTVGDRVSGLVGKDGAPRVRIESVKLENMPLRTFLVTKEQVTSDDPTGYTKKELGSDVLAVDMDLLYEHSSRGVPFPGRLTLQQRSGSGGSIVVVDVLPHQFVLDDGVDSCGCHDFFFLPQRGREYRVEVQILRPNMPKSEPLADYTSDWSRL